MKSYFLWLAKLITLMVVVLFVVPVMLVATIGVLAASNIESIGDNSHSVAVITLDGVIEDSKEVVEALYKQVNDEKIKGVVLRINSPGGSVGPSQDIYSAVRKLKEKKPIVASFGSVAASGGFYAALGASKIYCQPGTITGSIGVIMQVPNFTKISDTVGFQMVTVKSGALKDVGNSFREMTTEERAFLEETVHTVHADFIKAIIEGRGLTKEEILPFADGRIIIGSQAKELKLVDEFGDVHDAARAVFELLGTPLKEDQQPKLIYVDEKLESLKRILESVIKLPAVSTTGFSLRFSMF